MDQSLLRTQTLKFRQTLADLIVTIREALQAYESLPLNESAYDYDKWKNTALRLLTVDLASIDVALDNLQTGASLSNLAKIALSESGLAKKLDTFSFTFAGAIYGERLSEQVRGTVIQGATLANMLSEVKPS